MLFAACRIAKRFTRAQSRRSTSLTGLRRDCAVRLLAVAGRHQRADETEDRTGTDGRPEADQREAGQQIGHTGYGQRVESRVEDQSEEDQPEAGGFLNPPLCRNIQRTLFSMTAATTAVATFLIIYKTWCAKKRTHRELFDLIDIRTREFVLQNLLAWSQLTLDDLFNPFGKGWTGLHLLKMRRVQRDRFQRIIDNTKAALRKKGTRIEDSDHEEGGYAA